MIDTILLPNILFAATLGGLYAFIARRYHEWIVGRPYSQSKREIFFGMIARFAIVLFFGLAVYTTGEFNTTSALSFAVTYVAVMIWFNRR